MAIIRNIIYVSILLFSLLTLSADQAGISDIYNVSKLTTCLLLLSVPFVSGHPSMRVYSNYLLLAISIMSIYGVIILDHTLFLKWIFMLGTANIVVARAFITFKGYTFNTWNLIGLMLLLVACSTCIYLEKGYISPLLVLYFITALFMVWQGSNLYFQVKSTGNLIIFIGLICFLLANLFYGIFQFFDDSRIYDSLALTFFWLYVFLIVHSSTLSEKVFR